VSRKHGYIDNILELKRKKSTIIFKKMCSLGRGHPRCTFSRCQHSGLQVVLIWWGRCNLGVTLQTHGSCLTMSNMFRDGPPWLVMSWLLLFVTWSLKTSIHNASCGLPLLGFLKNMVWRTQTSRVLWLIVLKLFLGSRRRRFKQWRL
jgi:hypothetical protein